MSEYDDLVKEAKVKAAAFQSTAREYVPKMYQALRNENQEIPPADARDRIEKDCVGIWSKRTILDALPDEAKNPEKQKAGRLGQAKRNSAAFSAAPEAKKKIVIDTQGRPISEVSPETSIVDDSIADSKITVEKSQQNRSEKQIESDLEECSSCKELNVEDHELKEALRKPTTLSTADTTTKHSYSPEVSNEDVPDNLNLEFSLPYLDVQQYTAKEYQLGKSTVWFNVEVNVKTKKVISAKVGRTTESSISN